MALTFHYEKKSIGTTTDRAEQRREEEESGRAMDRRQADLLIDLRRLRNGDLNHRSGYGRDRRRPPRSRSRIYLISS